jgi:hypothetical protein
MQPLPNLIAPIVDKATGILIRPWVQFLQQFVQQPPKIVTVLGPYTAKEPGYIIVTGGGVVTLTRGIVSIILTGQVIIPVSIKDTVTAPSATLQFIPIYGASTTNG